MNELTWVGGGTAEGLGLEDHKSLEVEPAINLGMANEVEGKIRKQAEKKGSQDGKKYFQESIMLSAAKRLSSLVTKKGSLGFGNKIIKLLIRTT